MIEKILKYNQLWSEVQKLSDETYFRHLRDGQSPEYLWIGCSDSRVPAETLLGLQPGQLFVHRNVANIIKTDDDNSMSVLQYAVDVLKVRHVIICGHSECGGIGAALDGDVNSYIQNWLQDVRQLALDCTDPIFIEADKTQKKEMLTEMNVKMQVRNLAKDDVILNAWKRGHNVAIHGWVFNIGQGLIKDLEVSVSGSL